MLTFENFYAILLLTHERGDEILVEIKERIIQLRKQLNLSQESFGKKIGLSKSGISNIENGTRTISDTHIKIICSTFGVSEQWLRTGDDLARTVKELECFIEYLKSLNFFVKTEPISETEMEITVQNQTCVVTFTEEEFTSLKEKNKELITGMILLQSQKNKKEPSSAATDNGSSKVSNENTKKK